MLNPADRDFSEALIDKGDFAVFCFGADPCGEFRMD